MFFLFFFVVVEMWTKQIYFRQKYRHQDILEITDQYYCSVKASLLLSGANETKKRA